MFLFNKDNLLKFKEYLLKLNKFEILLITILFLSVIFKFNYHDICTEVEVSSIKSQSSHLIIIYYFICLF